MDPTQRFSNRVENYRRYRPGYPSAVVDLIRETAGLSTGAALADIGSGTGILTRKLLEADFDVTAVEPNDAMRQAAEEDLRTFPRFHSVAAPAEQTGLPDHHFAALTAAQSFHWFQREPARLEFRRILQPEGWAFLIWNERKASRSPFDGAYQDLLASLGQSYEGVRNRSGEESLEDFFVAGSYQMAHFDNPQIMTWDELRGRFLSSSYVPAEGDPQHEPLLAKLEEIFHQHEKQGRVTFDQQTNVYYGRV